MHTKTEKRLNNFSLKTKLLLSFSVIVFSLVVTTIYATQSVAKKHSKRLLNDNIRVSEVVVTEHVNDIAKVLHKAATNLSLDFSVKSLILNIDQDVSSLNVAMNNFSQRFDTTDFAVLSPNGEVLANSPGFNLGTLSNKHEFLGEQGAWLFFNDSYYLTVVVPVKNTPLSRNAMAYLVFAKPIYSIFDDELSFLSNLDVAVMAQNIGANQSVVFSTIGLESAQKLLNNKRLIENDLYESHFSERSYFGAIKPFVEQEKLTLGLMLFTEEEKVFLSYSALLKNIIILLVVATILVLGFALIFSEIISRPLLKLSEVASKIGKGEDFVSVPKGNTKEVNRLSDAISQMNDNLKKRNNEVQRLAFEDPLTALPNRTAFYEYVNTYFTKAPNSALALILIDISKFTDINEAIGYKSADGVLKAIATRLHTSFAGQLMTIRMAGNQFGILSEDTANITTLIQSVIDTLHAPFQLDELSIAVNSNIGCAETNANIKDARALAQAADIALKVAKTSYAPFTIFDDSLNLFDTHKLTLMTELGDITQNGSLSLHYQPQLHLQDNSVKSVECLARWMHPSYGFIAPDVFIGLAEQSGKIKEITRFVIAEAIKQHCRWRDLGYDIVMAVNISTIDLSDISFADFVFDLLCASNMSPQRLIIEVTESAAMEEPELAIKSLIRLSEIGIKLSIDDFGTGYSSMAQLKKMPVQELKIDKAFVLNLAKDKEDQTMVATFISLAKNLHLCTVAEGVEDEESLHKLTEMGCTYAQGYFISRPLNQEAITTWFKNSEQFDIAKVAEV